MSTQPVVDISEILAQSPTCRLQPLCFFVSWQGVLTLAFRGFPPALLNLKECLSVRYASLPKENSGSKWPKSTLGALKDKERLTPEQLETLKCICRDESQDLRGGDPLNLRVGRAAVALYECRSLEKVLSWKEVGFQQIVDTSVPAVEEEERVRKILAEADDDDYWFAASRDGNRESHYRDAHMGATLIFPMRPAGSGDSVDQDVKVLLERIKHFQARVDAKLPNMYAWFKEESLHVTLRALIN